MVAAAKGIRSQFEANWHTLGTVILVGGGASAIAGCALGQQPDCELLLTGL